jgi:hypothetical protein
MPEGLLIDPSKVEECDFEYARVRPAAPANDDWARVAEKAAELIQRMYLPDYRTATGATVARQEIAAIILRALENSNG